MIYNNNGTNNQKESLFWVNINNTNNNPAGSGQPLFDINNNNNATNNTNSESSFFDVNKNNNTTSLFTINHKNVNNNGKGILSEFNNTTTTENKANGEQSK